MVNLIFILDCIPFKNAIIIPLRSRICMFLIHFPFRLFLRHVTLEVHILVECKKKESSSTSWTLDQACQSQVHWLLCSANHSASILPETTHGTNKCVGFATGFGDRWTGRPILVRRWVVVGAGATRVMCPGCPRISVGLGLGGRTCGYVADLSFCRRDLFPALSLRVLPSRGKRVIMVAGGNWGRREDLAQKWEKGGGRDPLILLCAWCGQIFILIPN